MKSVVNEYSRDMSSLGTGEVVSQVTEALRIAIQGSGNIAPCIISTSTICRESALRPGRFVHGKRVPIALWVEGLLGL